MPSPREKNIWGNIRVQLNEVQNLILNGRYQNAVILNREILKTVVRLQVDRACLVADNLSADIQQLFSARAIDAASRDHYNEIRNYAEQAESGVNPGAQGANQAFSLMKDELEKYMNSANRQAAAPVSRAANAEREERPRVPLSGKAGRNGAGTERAREMSRLSGTGRSSDRVAGKASGSSNRTRSGGAASGRSTANRSGRSGKSSGSARRNARNEQPVEIDIYSVLKIAIPVACVLLVIILIRVLTMGGGTIETTAVPTTPAAVETTAAPETTVEETTVEETTEAVPEKMVTTSGVRVRTKPSTEDSEVLDVLDPDTEVTYKGAYDNEWAIIDYNGQEAYVSSQYLKAAS